MDKLKAIISRYFSFMLISRISGSLQNKAYVFVSVKSGNNSTLK